jgi:CMP-2-keto-3-deoxyoctulosonic acid synthetase
MRIGSVIARLGSKRLPYKNLLPFKGVPLVRRGVLKLLECRSIDLVVLSTESELIARQVEDLDVKIVERPAKLSEDNVPSVPVFQHIMALFPAETHVNYNINFPYCEEAVIEKAISIAESNDRGESLSKPYAVWAQTRECLDHYGDPWDIRAELFHHEGVSEPDIHTEVDLLNAHRLSDHEKLLWYRP